jgi:methionyl-tRNA synthetase
MNTSYDKFVRTTNQEHEQIVQKIFRKYYEQGDIYKGEYKGLYCTPCESFWTESQLIDGKCPDCGREVHEAKEEAYFFKMSKYSKWLENYINNHPNFIEPEARKNEIMNNFIKPGLQDLCVSRTSFTWGIPVDFDNKHVVYVWIDALANYITFIGYNPEGENSDEFKKLWPADVQVIGKDILRFHTIYWPIMLHALNLEIPKKIFGHPWLLFGNDKMSKSKGNIVYADDLVQKYGVDAIRYYMLHEIPFASDGNYTQELLESAINSDLANVLGNLINRTLGMINKYFDGIVENLNINDEIDKKLKGLVVGTKDKVDTDMDNLKIADALDDIFEIYRACNKYIDETEPWILAKDESKQNRLKTVLYNLVESERYATVLLSAFLPNTAESIFSQLNTDKTSYETLDKFGYYENGKIGDAKVLFQRIINE